MARGVNRRDIFIDDEDRLDFMSRIRLLEKSAGAKVLAHCLMGNHFHLAIRVGAVPLSSFMHRQVGGYSRAHNFRHGRTGHLFENRYKAFLCTDDRYLARLIPYIHMNPVRAGLVAAPWEWRWSSFTGTALYADDLSDFNPWPEEGTREFELIRREERGQPSFGLIAESVRLETGLDSDALKSCLRARRLIAARRKFVEYSIASGYSQRNIADWLGSTCSAISRFAQKWESGRPDTKL